MTFFINFSQNLGSLVNLQAQIFLQIKENFLIYLNITSPL